MFLSQALLSKIESLRFQALEFALDFVLLKWNLMGLFRCGPEIWCGEASIEVGSIIVHHGNWEQDIHAKLLEIRPLHNCKLRDDFVP